MIGVFDSGVGGLSVLTQIRALLPSADLLYVADRARAPYGPRSLEEVESITLKVGQWLVDHGVSTLVVACNTASAAALEALRSRFELPVVGMEPAVKPAASLTRTGVVAVFATATTFQGRLFESLLSRHGNGVEVLTRACPEWVELVERGITKGVEAERIVGEGVSRALAAKADVMVLGCTHFSFLTPLLEKLAGDRLALIDPAPAVAAQTARVTPDGHGGDGRLLLAGSGDLDELTRLARVLANTVTDEPAIPFP